MKADKLIQDYKAKGHPLGDELTVMETDALILALRHRVNATEQELDLSPNSLKRLEGYLHSYQRTLLETNIKPEDDEVVRLVREIAAYLGRVLVTHADATWRGGRSLWDTSVQVEGPITLVEGRRSSVSNKLVYALGNQAAAAWDRIIEGHNTRLYSVYQSMRNKAVKQQLN